MSATVMVGPDVISHDFRTAMHGKMPEDDINNIVASLTALAGATAYPAEGSIASLLFYMKVQVTVKDSKTFNGNAGTIGSPGGGALWGHLYTDDINLVYRDTQSFELNATPVYTSIIFFNGKSQVLGSFQAGALSTVLGIGGGTGSWT